MFRGAFILAVGYALGYAHAAAQNEEISKAMRDVKRAWAEADTIDTNQGESAQS